MLRLTKVVLQQGPPQASHKARFPRQFFPIKDRYIDTRVEPEAAMCAAQMTMRRREQRTPESRGATRQTDAPLRSKRPTHFLALAMPPKNVFSKSAAHVLEEMRFANAALAPLFVAPVKYHVTLCVLSLQTAEASHATMRVMQDVAPRLGDLELSFRGLGTFQDGRVLFARVASERGFVRLDETVRHMRLTLGLEHGVDVTGNPHDGYVPHVTLAKARRRGADGPASGASGRSVGIALSDWAKFQFHNFGDVVFRELQLCEMASDESTGYYNVAHRVQLGA